MGRKPRKISRTGLYHVIIRGNNRQKLFHGAQDFKQYLEFLGAYLEKYPIQIHHYCLMTNHVHLLIKALEFKDLSSFMHGVQRGYHHYYRKAYTHFGHLFQGRFRSLSIEDEGYLLECGRYIERNPVRAKLVKHPKDWLYSSYADYANGYGTEWLTHSAAYLGLSDNEEDRKVLYRNHVEQGRPYEEILDKELVDA